MITLFKQHPGQLLQHLRHRFEPSATCACAVTVPHLPCITLMLLAPFSLTAATYINNIALVAGLSVMAAGKAGAVREAWRADGGCRRESGGGALRGYLQLVGSTLSPA